MQAVKTSINEWLHVSIFLFNTYAEAADPPAVQTIEKSMHPKSYDTWVVSLVSGCQFDDLIEVYLYHDIKRETNVKIIF